MQVGVSVLFVKDDQQLSMVAQAQPRIGKREAAGAVRGFRCKPGPVGDDRPDLLGKRGRQFLRDCRTCICSAVLPAAVSPSTVSTVAGARFPDCAAMGQRTAEKAVAAWMTSASHRENILRKSYGSVGICAYKADGVMYWVQLFGK